jgi:hypothetical protein
MAHDCCRGCPRHHTTTSWQRGKMTTKLTTTKCNKRGREAGAPANLTQQPTKEQEGCDGATSGGSAGQQSLSWLSSLTYRNMVTMGKNNNKNNNNRVQQEGEGGQGPGQLDARTNWGTRGTQWRKEWRWHQAKAQQEGGGGWPWRWSMQCQTNQQEGCSSATREGERSGHQAT